jgi:tetratricopeptide (TPR) repeat protein
MLDQEVTADWYRHFLESDDHPEGEKLTEAARRADLSHAVANVDWYSAILFCNWLSRAEGRTPCYRPDASGRLGLHCDFRANGYRLPTDAEWEYVFRSGTTTRFVTGDDSRRMLDYGRVFAADFGPGKQFYPNPWGLFDLLGNWWEMCWDTGYTEGVSGLSVNPVGAVGAVHSIRGGSFDAGPFHLHASYRSDETAERPSLFRPVCGPLEAPAEPDPKAAALRVLTRWVERFPGYRPQVWKERGRLYAELGRYEEAVSDYSRALELAPWSGWIAEDLAQWDDGFARVVAAGHRGAGLWWARTNWLGRSGRWPEAAVASGKALELLSTQGWCWSCDAVLRLQIGDHEGYRRDCREMLQRFQGMRHNYLVDYTAKTCLLHPNALADLKPVLELARRPLAGTEKDVAYPWFLLCRALADYRDGQFDAAVEGINQVSPKPNGAALDATAYVVLALAESRRGHPAEARQALLRARTLRELRWPRFQALDARRVVEEAWQALQELKWPRLDRAERFGADWSDWLRCEVLRREAEALIDPDSQMRRLPEGPVPNAGGKGQPP